MSSKHHHLVHHLPVIPKCGQNDCSQAVLMEIARLNDEAVFQWATLADTTSVQELLTEALAKVNMQSRAIMARVQQQNGKNILRDRSESTDQRDQPFVLPLTVDVGHEVATATFNKAFLLKATILGDASIIDSLSVAAAVVFYNTALFFHHSIAGCGNLATSKVLRYYEISNDVLGEYLERTQRPAWTLQAAIWHNLADCARNQTVESITAEAYIEKLQSIIGLVDDEFFFKRGHRRCKSTQGH